MKVEGKIRSLILSLAFIFVATILIPHQHHADGTPCFEIIHQHGHEDAPESTGHTSHDDCASFGHNVIYHGDNHQEYKYYINPVLILFPLYAIYTIDSYIQPPVSFGAWECPEYAESIYHVHLVRSLGLRAPPRV